MAAAKFRHRLGMAQPVGIGVIDVGMSFESCTVFVFQAESILYCIDMYQALVQRYSSVSRMQDLLDSRVDSPCHSHGIGISIQVD